MRVPKRRQPAESGERGQVPLAVAALLGAAERVIRSRWPGRRRSESSGHPTAARQRTCTHTTRKRTRTRSSRISDDGRRRTRQKQKCTRFTLNAMVWCVVWQMKIYYFIIICLYEIVLFTRFKNTTART